MNAEFERILIDDLSLDEAALDPQTSLEDAGIDSLSLVELSVSLSQVFGVQISEEELQGAVSLGAVEDLVERRRKASTGDQ